MEFSKILKGHFWTHGISDPLDHLAKELKVHRETIALYCRQANNGVGDGKSQLSPKTAAWLIEQSFKVMEDGEFRNPVRTFLQPKTEGDK